MSFLFIPCLRIMIMIRSCPYKRGYYHQLELSKQSPGRIFIDFSKWRARDGTEDHNTALNWSFIIKDQLHLEALCIQTSKPSDPCTSWFYTTPLPILLCIRFLRVEWEILGDEVSTDLSGASQLQTLDLWLPYSSDGPPLSLSCPQKLFELRLWGSISLVDAFRIITRSKETLQNLIGQAELLWIIACSPLPLGI
ncbi:hypothetical protein DL93DRAFT_1599382 [Clavulina sp. PMI_390]|nr:hypothetical protein DL93DRAFT_1599382 [Clavulina sp. PMI_390]